MDSDRETSTTSAELVKIDESYWPAGSSEVLRRWLVTSYDPAKHPALVTSRRDGFDYVLGWDQGEYEVPLQLIVHLLLGHELKESEPCACGYYAAPTCNDCGEDLEGPDHEWCES